MSSAIIVAVNLMLSIIFLLMIVAPFVGPLGFFVPQDCCGLFVTLFLRIAAAFWQLCSIRNVMILRIVSVQMILFSNAGFSLKAASKMQEKCNSRRGRLRFFTEWCDDDKV